MIAALVVMVALWAIGYIVVNSLDRSDEVL